MPISTQCLHAAGAALAFKLRGEAHVAVSSCGDGGSSKTDFYAALNTAGAHKLPLILCVVNNGWAISVPRSAQTGAQTLAQKGIAGGLFCLQVDGNDLVAVLEARRSGPQQAAGRLVDAGLSQREAAAELGVSQQAVHSRLRHGLWNETRLALDGLLPLLERLGRTGE